MNTDWIDEEILKPARWQLNDYKKAKARITAELRKAEVAALQQIKDQLIYCTSSPSGQQWVDGHNDATKKVEKNINRLQALKAQTLKEGDNEKN